MTLSLLIHIAAGALGLATGYVALYAAKGATVHRAAGRLFVYAMVVMGLSGSIIAAFEGERISVIAGVVTAYLVVTALTTVLPPSPWLQRVDRTAMILAVALGITSVLLGAIPGVRGNESAVPYLVIGLPALFGGIGDARILRSGALRGIPRLRRHLWRMTWALLIAALSFFLGQADEFPKPVRDSGLLALPVLAVLLTLLFWLWRVRTPGRGAAAPVESRSPWFSTYSVHQRAVPVGRASKQSPDQP